MKVISGVLGLLFKLYVGLLFLTTLLLFYPFFLIVLSRQSWKRYSFPLNVAWSYAVRFLTFTRVVKMDFRHLPKGPYLIVSNHASYYDIFLMYSILPHHRFLFMGKSEILSYPLVNLFFKRLNIPVHRNDRLKAGKSFIKARQEIQNGWSLVVFPEGGIPDSAPAMVPFKPGAFKLAKMCCIPIVPMTFLDNYHLFSDPGELLGPAHPGRSRVVFHPVIHPHEFADWTDQQLSDKVWTVIAEPLIREGLMANEIPAE